MLFDHIDMIHHVCEQYQLKGCLTDPTLHQLMDIVKDLSFEDTRAKLTAVDVLKKVWRVLYIFMIINYV